MTKAALIDRTLSREQEADLRAAERITEPDTADIPEAPVANWQFARRIYRPRKEAISLRIDADVLVWLRQKHDHYQSEINRILREKMASELSVMPASVPPPRSR